MRVQVAGIYAARALHQLGQRRRLAARRGAGVQHLHARPGRKHLRAQQRAFALHAEQALTIQRVLIHSPHAVHAVCARHARALVAQPRRVQPALELRRIDAQRVGAQNDVPAAAPGQYALGLLRAVLLHQCRAHELGHGVFHSQVPFQPVLARGQLQLAPAPHEVAQHAVDHAGSALKAQRAREAHRFVAHRARRHALQVHELVEGYAQHVQHRLFGRARHQLAQQQVNLGHVLERAVENFGGQCPVGGAHMRLAQHPVQRQPGIRALARDQPQRPVCRAPRGRAVRHARRVGADLRRAGGVLVTAIALNRAGSLPAHSIALRRAGRMPVTAFALHRTSGMHVTAFALHRAGRMPVTAFALHRAGGMSVTALALRRAGGMSVTAFALHRAGGVHVAAFALRRAGRVPVAVLALHRAGGTPIIALALNRMASLPALSHTPLLPFPALALRRAALGGAPRLPYQRLACAFPARIVSHCPPPRPAGSPPAWVCR